MTTTQRMIEKINERIKVAVEWYDETQKFDGAAIREIKSMIEMLEIATDKMYTFDRNGVHEYHII